MVRVFFPSMYMRLISWKPNKTPPQALLHVPPAMTKHEITEYLTKIYDVNVNKVMTANFLGNTDYSYFLSILNAFMRYHYVVCRKMEKILWQETNLIIQAKEL